MKKVDTRKIQVLKCIVEAYLKTGDVMGSKSLLNQYNFEVSSATIRNDMMALEKMGLIFQPYNSAGRLPTDRGIRIFVDYLMEDLPAIFLEEDITKTEFVAREGLIDDVLYDVVNRIQMTTEEVAFACIPIEGALIYLGLTHLLMQSSNDSASMHNAHQMIAFLENKSRVIHTLSHLQISPKVSVFIGDEYESADLAHVTMIVKTISLHGHHGYLGIIGNIKMDYAFNIATLRQVL